MFFAGFQCIVSNCVYFPITFISIKDTSRALSFLLSWGAADQALEWTLLDSATRSSIKAQYKNAGIKVSLYLTFFQKPYSPVLPHP